MTHELSSEKIKELFDKYLKVDPKCIICSTPVLGKRVNIARLEGKSYRDIISEFSDQFAKTTDRAGINRKQLVKHFNEHFNIEGLNLAEYLAVRDEKESDQDQSTGSDEGINELELLLNSDTVGDIELLDAAAREQIRQLMELKEITKKKKEENRTFNLDKLIMQQQKIAKELGTLAAKKMSIMSRANLEKSQSDYYKGLTFLTSKLGDNFDISLLNTKIENVYLKTVITLMIHKVNNSLLEVMPDIDRVAHVSFLNSLKAQIEGMSQDVDAEFRKQVAQMVENTKQLSSKNKTLTHVDLDNICDAKFEELD